MGAHDRGLEKEGARQGTIPRLEAFPEPAPAPAPFPAAEAVRDCVPVPKVCWQVTPPNRVKIFVTPVRK
jgi:hypothetical protein